MAIDEERGKEREREEQLENTKEPPLEQSNRSMGISPLGGSITSCHHRVLSPTSLFYNHWLLLLLL